MPDLREEDLPTTPAAAGGPLQRLVRGTIRDRRVRYLATGVLATAVYYVYFTAGWLTLSDHIPYLLMAVISNLLTAITCYPVYRGGVFEHNGPWWSGFFRFYTVFVGGLIWSLILLPPLVELLHIHVLISLAIAVVLLPIVSYQVNKLWVFSHRGGRTS